MLLATTYMRAARTCKTKNNDFKISYGKHFAAPCYLLFEKSQQEWLLCQVGFSHQGTLYPWLVAVGLE